jgi:hypothetical protein
MRIVTVAYNGRGLEIPYRPELPLQCLATDAIRAHGLRFAKNAHLHLHDRGTPLDHTAPAKAACLKRGTRLTLQPLAESAA